MGLLVLGTLAVAFQGPANFIRPDAGMALVAIRLIMWFAPKIATVLDVISRPALRNAFGGAGRVVLSTITETIFFLMLWAVIWFGHTIVLTRLGLGAGSAQCVRRGRAVRAEHDHRNDLLPDAVADHVVRPHHVPHRPGARAEDRLGRAGA